MKREKVTDERRKGGIVMVYINIYCTLVYLISWACFTPIAGLLIEALGGRYRQVEEMHLPEWILKYCIFNMIKSKEYELKTRFFFTCAYAVSRGYRQTWWNVSIS